MRDKTSLESRKWINTIDKEKLENNFEEITQNKRNKNDYIQANVYKRANICITGASGVGDGRCLVIS